MRQFIKNPKSKNELSGMKDETLVKYGYDNGLLLKISDCYELSRNTFIEALYQAQFQQVKENFYDIMDNPDYFEREDDTRYYLICMDCGHVTKADVDHESEYLDLHCKCGSAMYHGEFTEDEIDEMRRTKQENEDYGNYAMKDFYDDIREESITYSIKMFREIWYYGYRL